MSKRALMTLALGLVIAGCAARATNTLPQEKRDALRIDAVDVSYAEGATVQWFDAEGGPEELEAKRAFLRQKAIGPIKAALDAEIPAAFRGTDPARLRVRIREVIIPAAAFRIIVASSPYTIKADIQLIDTKTGKTLVEAPDFQALSQSYGGIAGIAETAVADDPIIRVSKAYARAVQTWLKKGF